MALRTVQTNAPVLLETSAATFKRPGYQTASGSEPRKTRRQAIFKPRYTFQMLWQICFKMASCGYLSVQICIKPCSYQDKAIGNIPECFLRSKNQECSKWSLRRREGLWRERFGTTFLDIPALKAHAKQPEDRLAHFDSY